MIRWYTTLLLLAILLAGCSPSLWNGNLSEAAWYSQEGHIVVHVRVKEGYSITRENLDELVFSLAERAVMTENHGLYVVIQRGDRCIAILGLPYGHDAYRVLTYQDILWGYGVKAAWPIDRIEERVIVCNYAWLFGLHYREDHPWFPELVAGKPKPLDSAFTYGE